jgi:hypothetical protein
MTAIILTITLLAFVPSREPKSKHSGEEQESVRSALECSQSAAEQDPLIREAIANQYWVRRVEFSGNQYTRDKVLRRKIMLEEGDVFTRENLVKSLESVSMLKRIIYPVKMSDVIVRLDRPEKIIDMTICFKERPHHRAKRGSGKRAS